MNYLELISKANNGDYLYRKQPTDKWDSFTHLDIIVELENTFGISFTPQEMGAIKSYQDIIDIVSKKLSQ